ncbi:MAG: hypothetical protein IPK58_20770 [Acidobacteria bacterium]|nr:hypothetical protein [Acidobacteriota bacterium]
MSEKIDLENPEMGVGGFGIKDDGSVWYSDSTRGTEGVKSRLFVNGKANWSFGEFLSPVISTESGHFIAARSDRQIGDSDLSGMLVFSSDDGQSWTPITKPYQTEFKTLAPDIRNRNVFRALTANGRVIRLEVRDSLAN